MANTDCACPAAEGYEWALLPAELQTGNTPPMETVEPSWFTTMFETGSSYLSLAVTRADALVDALPGPSSLYYAFFLLLLLSWLRPHRTIVNNHYHRGSRRAGRR